MRKLIRFNLTMIPRPEMHKEVPRRLACFEIVHEAGMRKVLESEGVTKEERWTRMVKHLHRSQLVIDTIRHSLSLRMWTFVE